MTVEQVKADLRKVMTEFFELVSTRVEETGETPKVAASAVRRVRPDLPQNEDRLKYLLREMNRSANEIERLCANDEIVRLTRRKMEMSGEVSFERALRLVGRERTDLCELRDLRR